MNTDDRHLDLWDSRDVTWSPGEPKHELAQEETDRIEFCANLQKAIDDANPDDVMLLYTQGDGNDTPDDAQKQKDIDSILQSSTGRGRRKTPEVFAQDGKRVNSFAGILQYDNKTVYLHSRFDQTMTEDGTYADRFLSYILRHVGVPAALENSFAPTSGNDLVSLLLPRAFLQQLSSAFQQGFYRRYQTVEYNDSRVRGRIDIARHIRLNPKESNGRVAYSTREYTLDNPLNHLVLAAYGVLRRNYGAQLDAYLHSEPELRYPIAVLETQLGREDLSPAALRKLMAHANVPVTHPMLQGYETLRRMALRILRCEGKNPFLRDSDEGGNVAGILIPMPRAWERMLETMLHGILPEGGQQKRQILDKRRDIIPDLLFRDIVFDAKYKDGWEHAFETELKQELVSERTPYWSGPGVREDVFQILAYMYALCCNTGGVVFPYPGETHAEPRRFRVSKDRDADFWLMPFSVPVGQMNQETYDGFMRASSEQLTDWFRAKLKQN